MATPKHLELYYCEGGSGKGYENAGLDVYAIDLFKYRDEKGKLVGFDRSRALVPTYQGDVIDALERLIAGECLPFTHLDGTVEWLGLKDFRSAGASPPCQKYSITNAAGREYPDLVAATRDLLIQTGLPWIMENVVGAPLIDPVELCGCMFNLKAEDDDGIMLHLWRPRQFESNVPLTQPRPGSAKVPRSKVEAHHEEFHAYEWVAGSYGGARRDKYEAKYVRKGGYVPSFKVQQKLLGIDWMSEKGMHQSIPPIYTEYLGHQLQAALILRQDV